MKKLKKFFTDLFEKTADQEAAIAKRKADKALATAAKKADKEKRKADKKAASDKKRADKAIATASKRAERKARRQARRDAIKKRIADFRKKIADRKATRKAARAKKWADKATASAIKKAEKAKRKAERAEKKEAKKAARAEKITSEVMKKMRNKIKLFLLVLTVILLVMSSILSTVTFLIILAVTIAFVGVFLLQGFKKISADPPEVGQLTVLGKRIEGNYLKEGWHFLPLYPFWFGMILVNVEKKTVTIVAETVRTPDRANSKIPVFIAYRPVNSLLVNYLNSKGEKGVEEQILGKIEERIREWAMGQEEGPADWIELNQSKLEATSILVTNLAKNSITKVPLFAQKVPTWIWLRYYSEPKPKKFFKNEKKWTARNWKKVEDELAEIKANHGDEGVEALEEAVEKRRQDIKNLQLGNGTIVLNDLGIVLERMNIGNIDVLGKVAEMADNEAKEAMERKAEALEVKNILERVKEFMGEPYKFTPEHALEAVLVNMEKIPKSIKEKKLNASSETLEALKEMLPEALKTVLALLNKNGGTP
ncbi:MAG: SPFH domain-containing protein [Patescibacteria group bacterium]